MEEIVMVIAFSARIDSYRIALFICLGLFIPTALAEPYPNKPVRIIVSVMPGDTCDVIVRQVAFKIGERLKQQFVVDNRSGASGAIGHALVAQSSPDGYTLGCGNGGSMSILPHVLKNTPYNTLKDFSAIALMATNYMALAVSMNLPPKNVSELISFAKQSPGHVSFGSNGEGAFLHFATELFRSQAGFTYLHVPFKGFPQLAGELVSGRLDATFGSFPTLHPYVLSKRIRLLGIGRLKRIANYPDYPTIAETLPGFASGGWFGLIGPAGLPKNIVTVLNSEANHALSQPDIHDRLIATGLDVSNETADYFTQYNRSEFEKYGKIAKEIGLAAQ
jgi:hypothetical protein